MQLASGTTIRVSIPAPKVTPVYSTRGEKGDAGTPGAPGGSDAAQAGWINDPASATRAALSATYARVETVDLRTFLAPGQALPNDGASDAAALIRTAVNALSAAATTDGPKILYVPTGHYRIDTTIVWPTKTGIIGAGRHNTVFLPVGTAVLAQAASSTYTGTTLDDCVFADFTVDCIGQASTGTDAGTKAFALRFMKNGRFERVTAKNSWATAFGCDFLQDVSFVDCRSIGSGRGMTGSKFGIGAGFGIGVGDFNRERVTFTNCTAVDGYSGGFFFERLTVLDSVAEARGVTMVNCTARNHHVGLQDAGAHGLAAIGCHFTDNLMAGVALRGSSPILGPRHGGKDGLVSGCEIMANGGLTGSAGILLAYAGNGGYTFEGNEIVENIGPGVWAPSTSLLGTSHVVRGNRIERNSGAGVLLEAPLVDRPEVESNIIRGNGTDPAQTYRGGVIITTNNIEPKVINNRIGAHVGPAVGLMNAAAISASPMVRGNACVDNTGGGVVNQHVTADASQITGNRETAAVTTITNYATNPSAEVDATNFVIFGNVTGPTVVTSGGKSGSNFVRFVATSTTPSLRCHRSAAGSVAAGEVWTLSAWVRAPLNRIWRPSVRFYATPSNIDLNGGGYRATGDWQRIVFTVILPPTTVQFDFLPRLDGASSGDQLDVDAVMATKGSAVWDYFDGSFSGCAWTGTANASTSTKTV